MFCPYCHHKLIEGAKVNYCTFEGREIPKKKSLKNEKVKDVSHPEQSEGTSSDMTEVQKAEKEPHNGFKDRIFGLLFLLGLTAAALLLYLFFFGQKTLSDRLAPDSSLTFSVFKVDEKDSEVRPLLKLLKLFPNYEKNLKAQREQLLRLLKLDELTYDTDIAPWLGKEIGLSTLSSASVAFAHIKDGRTDTAAAALSKLSSRRKERSYTEETESYKGTTIYTYKQKGFSIPPYPPFLQGIAESSPIIRPEPAGEREIDSFVIYKNFLIRSETKETLKAALDAAEDGRTISKNKNYRKVKSKLGPNFVFTFINYPKIREESGVNDLMGSFLLANAPQTEYIEGSGYALRATRRGIKLFGYTFADHSRLPAGTSLSFGKLAEQKIINTLPYETSVLFESSDLKDVFDSYKNHPDSKTRDEFNKSLKDANAALKMDLEKDIFSWMTEEYAAALYSGRGQLAGAVIFNLKDRPAAERGIKKIEEFFTSEKETVLPLKNVRQIKAAAELANKIAPTAEVQKSTVTPAPLLETEQYRGYEIRKLLYSDGFFRFEIGYAFVDDQLLLTAGNMEGIKSYIDSKKDVRTKLIEKEVFKKAMAELPKQNNGLFYIDVRELFDAVRMAYPSLSGYVNADEFKPLKAIAATSAASDSELVTEGFILIENY